MNISFEAISKLRTIQDVLEIQKSYSSIDEHAGTNAQSTGFLPALLLIKFNGVNKNE